MGSNIAGAIGFLGTPNSRIDNHVVDGANTEDSDNFVPLQFKPFAGEYSQYAISPELASQKIQNVDLLLDVLNKIFDTNIPISYLGIQKTLKHLINKGYNLGAAYAHLQVIWPVISIPSISAKPFTDNNFDYIVRSPKLTFRKCQDVDELLSFLNMSFGTKIHRFYPGIE